jgi:hypothetical protein
MTKIIVFVKWPYENLARVKLFEFAQIDFYLRTMKLQNKHNK